MSDSAEPPNSLGDISLVDAIIEHLPVMIFLKDAENLAFQRVNKAFEELVGVPRADLLGKTDFDFFPADQAEFFRGMDRETLDTGTPREALAEPLNTPAGTRWLHTKKVPLLGPEGRAAYLLGISVDITEQRRVANELRRAHVELERRVEERTAELSQEVAERRRTEAALRQSQDLLLRTQKMDAIGRLAGGVAHDFNNMLTVITTYVGLLRGKLGLPEPVRRDIEEIGHAAERATKLTRQLLLFSSHQVIEVQAVDINQLLERLRHLIGRTLGEAIRLEFRLAEPLGRVMADPGQLEQAVMNLVLNARDAMPDGGALTIETARLDRLPRPGDGDELGSRPQLVLSFADTGLGMDRETQSRIFEPFFTTKPLGKGTGLGLATVFAVIGQCGGAIEVDSRPGGGTRFDISLPLALDGSGGAHPATAGDEPTGGTELILLVEDEPMVREAVKIVLVDLGYRVLEAADGPAGLRLADEHADELAMLISDVVMPSMGGAELARRLLARHPSVRVLFLSGYNEEDISDIGVGGEGHPFLQKPFVGDVLARRVREILDGSTAR